jgi:hypothetical protein
MACQSDPESSIINECKVCVIVSRSLAEGKNIAESLLPDVLPYDPKKLAAYPGKRAHTKGRFEGRLLGRMT